MTLLKSLANYRLIKIENLFDVIRIFESNGTCKKEQFVQKFKFKLKLFRHVQNRLDLIWDGSVHYKVNKKQLVKHLGKGFDKLIEMLSKSTFSVQRIR